jgi:uncharacterized protein (TIGR02246 family)
MNTINRRSALPFAAMVALMFLAVALQTLAQPKEGTVDPQTKTQLDALNQKYVTSIQSNDAAQMGTVFTKDAVLVTNKGPLHGQAEIETYFGDLFNNVHVIEHWVQADPTAVLVLAPDKMSCNGNWCMTFEIARWQAGGGGGFLVSSGSQGWGYLETPTVDLQRDSEIA